jgi:hypothetical protein
MGVAHRRVAADAVPGRFVMVGVARLAGFLHRPFEIRGVTLLACQARVPAMFERDGARNGCPRDRQVDLDGQLFRGRQLDRCVAPFTGAAKGGVPMMTRRALARSSAQATVLSVGGMACRARDAFVPRVREARAIALRRPKKRAGLIPPHGRRKERRRRRRCPAPRCGNERNPAARDRRRLMVGSRGRRVAVWKCPQPGEEGAASLGGRTRTAGSAMPVWQLLQSVACAFQVCAT